MAEVLKGPQREIRNYRLRVFASWDSHQSCWAPKRAVGMSQGSRHHVQAIVEPLGMLYLHRCLGTSSEGCQMQWLRPLSFGETSLVSCRGHHEIWKYCQSTSKVPY